MISPLSVYRGVAVLLLGITLITGTYIYVRNIGVLAERARWVEATALETERQKQVSAEALAASHEQANALRASEYARADLVRKLGHEANNEAGADAACIGAAGVMRLNSIGRKAPTD